jgi:RsiW-degrading membrane proteinase PrsW (M82 family)
MLLILGIFIGILPGFAWLYFFLKEDDRPGPLRLIFLVFFSGALVTFAAIYLERLYADWIHGAHTVANIFASVHGSQLLALLLGLALIEELLKFGVAFASIHRHPRFDEALHAMMYMVVAGLGFATAENILFAMGQVREGITAGLVSADVLGGTVETIVLRFVGATLLHALASGLIGYYWARGIMQGKEKHYLLAGVIIATVLHTAFNYLIIKYGNVEIIYPSLILVIAGVIVLYDFEKIKGTPRHIIDMRAATDEVASGSVQ